MTLMQIFIPITQKLHLNLLKVKINMGSENLHPRIRLDTPWYSPDIHVNVHHFRTSNKENELEKLI